MGKELEIRPIDANALIDILSKIKNGIRDECNRARPWKHAKENEGEA